MKLINKLIVAASAVFAMAAVSGCSDEKPDYQQFDSKDVDFTYNVDDDTYTLDFYVVSHIKFNNTSAKSGAVTWDFGDGTTSTEPNPVHKYAKAGTYRVTLTVDGVGSQTYPILIYDIAPVLTVATQSDEIVEFNHTTLTFNLELPNPENLKVRYEWKFPEGTSDVNGNPVSSFTGYADEQGNVSYPAAVKFGNIGSQRVEISTWFDTDGENRRLEDTYLNVQVGASEPCPTLYYAQKGGNIKALKLVDSTKLPKGTKVYPFDMGVSAGNNPFNLVYADVDGTDEDGNPAREGWIYILDAGKQYYYVNDVDGVLGDGYINAMRPDGTGVNTVLTNVGGAAFNDPFQGFATGGYLYYSDRNTGISRIELKTRGAVQGQNTSHQRDEYFVMNNLIPYYNRGISYGAISSCHYKDKAGKWWWAKGYSGTGIYRFKDNHIYKTQAEADAVVSPYPIVFSGAMVRSFVMDETRNALYVWRTHVKPGFYAFDIPADNQGGDIDKPNAYFAMDADPVNTTENEGIYTSQMALDSESGCVYFCWRPTATDESKVAAGIVRYNPATGKIEKFGDTSDLGFGICINPNKSKLF